MRWPAPVFMLLAACGRFGFDSPGPDSQPPDITTGLTVWLELDEGTGQIASDSSGSGLHGWLYSTVHVAWQPGKTGAGLRFNRTAYASHVLFPSSDSFCTAPPQIPGSFTVSAWVQFEAFGDWGGYTLSDAVVVQGSNGGDEGGWGLGATNACGNHTVGLAVDPSDSESGRTLHCGTTALNTGTWFHLAGVYDATARTIAVYVNGMNDGGALATGSLPVPAAIATPNACPYLAATANQQSLVLGTIDSVRLYTRALTAAEIDAIFVADGG